MTDPKIQISQFAVKEEQKLKAWWQSHWVTFIGGAAALEFLRWIVTHHL